MTNQERFHKLVSAEATNTIEQAKQRIAKRKAMKIGQEDFNRRAQHILDTVVKPQVERYEKAKAEGILVPKPRQVGASGFVVDIEQAAANLADPNACKTTNWIAGAEWMRAQLLNERDHEEDQAT
jgi:hypothetical protein